MDLGYPIIMAAVSALAIGNSIFFGIYLWGLEAKNRLPNRLLALALFALAVRISKSVIIIAFPQSSDVFPAIGLIGMAAIGPFLYLYLQSIHQEEFVFGRSKYLHFLPSLAIALALPLPFITEAVIYRFYQFVVAQILIYLGLGLYIHVERTGENAESLKTRWGYILLGSAFLIWLAFFFQLIIDTFFLYIVATTIAAFVLYGLSFWVMRNRLAFKQNGRLKKFNGDVGKIYEKIRKAFEEDKVYRDADLTVDDLAEKLNIQSYLLSMVINDRFNQSFPELVNSYRIEEAKSLLSSSSNQHLSVESIAYDSGFNSISSFYSSFKKFCNTTPAEYRKQFQA